MKYKVIIILYIFISNNSFCQEILNLSLFETYDYKLAYTVIKDSVLAKNQVSLVNNLTFKKEQDSIDFIIIPIFEFDDSIHLSYNTDDSFIK